MLRSPGTVALEDALCVLMGNDLSYVSDKLPGIVRRRNGKSFRYLDVEGRVIKCRDELARIQSLGIPPAYEQVWICHSANGHIQATGLDAAGRKQYRYHPDWVASQDQTKFDRLAMFGRALPRIRHRADLILANANTAKTFGKDIACAAIVRLIDQTAIRVGGRSKASQGATTLTNRNIVLDGKRMHLRFTAKGGRRVRATLDDRKLHRILSKIHDLPGKMLFQYVGGDGQIYPLDSGDVNSWLKDVSGQSEVSAKMYRTWHGSVSGLEAALSAKAPTVKQIAEAAAETLCNTPAIARKSYIHPAILDCASDQVRLELFKAQRAKRKSGLTAAEARLLLLLDDVQDRSQSVR